MLIAIWAVGLLLLVLWSATMWVSWVGWTMLADLPWSEAVESARDVQLPPLLERWFGDAWREWIEAMGPMIESLMRTLEGSAGWIDGIVPVALWIVWGLGAFCLLFLTALIASALGWFRRRRSRDRAAAA